jgi:hypothetical protein
MRHLLTILAALFLCAAPVQAQTLKSLMYNTTNGLVVANTGTNVLTLTNSVVFAEVKTPNFIVMSGENIVSQIANDAASFAVPVYVGNSSFTQGVVISQDGIDFLSSNAPTVKATTRTNLGLGATWLTNTNAANFRTATGLGSANHVEFGNVIIGGQLTYSPDGLQDAISGFEIDTAAGAITGVNGVVEIQGSLAFGGANASGNIVISNQTATNNGLLFIYRTNNEPFLGLANLIASNNTTISNETLFRVGTAEATNRSAQFGFRSTNTNGSGVAVFSVFGYNALAMVGPSARSATNTNGIEADIYSINPTNKVATLIDTNTGATLMHRPVGFTTNASTPSSTNTIVGWIQFFVGTNSVRVPYYQ